MVLQTLAHLNPETAIIGCGNPNRSDDGVGPYVVSLLRDRDLGDHISLYDGGTDGMGVMYQARGVERLIIIDARTPQNTPGALYEVPGDVLEMPPPQSLNLHDFRWDHALYVGRQIYGSAFPDNVLVFLIEAARLDLGLEISAQVQATALKVAQRIEHMVTTHGERTR